MIKIYCKWKGENPNRNAGKYLHLWYKYNVTHTSDIQGIIVRGYVIENSLGEIEKVK